MIFQDLKTFAEDDFDPKKWINRAWSTSGNQEKEVFYFIFIFSFVQVNNIFLVFSIFFITQVFVANTVSRLQLYMKQLTNSLDETTTQVHYFQDTFPIRLINETTKSRYVTFTVIRALNLLRAMQNCMHWQVLLAI